MCRAVSWALSWMVSVPLVPPGAQWEVTPTFATVETLVTDEPARMSSPPAALSSAPSVLLPVRMSVPGPILLTCAELAMAAAIVVGSCETTLSVAGPGPLVPAPVRVSVLAPSMV